MGLISCSKNEASSEIVLARVEDRVITVKDFKERSELTVRPPYVSGQVSKQKGVILNTLIAEKLLALEGTKDSVLVNNSSFRNYLAGVKEQTMRSRLVNVELEEELKITKAEKTEAYKQALKKIHVAYIFSNKKEEIDQLKEKIDQADFDSVEKIVNAAKKPHLKEVLWGDNLQSIENALFNETALVGSVIGPVKTRVGYYIFKIKEIRREVILGQGSTDTKIRKIESVLFDRKWRKATANYVYNLMKDKDIKLDEKGFNVLLEYYKPFYTENELEKPDSTESEERVLDALKDLQNNLDTPLLTIDDESWTIKKFVDETNRRPLMFHSNKMNESEFPEYLKLAIKDLLTDKYLTDRAYENGIDKDPLVKREENIWHDYLLATGKRALLLKQLGYSRKTDDNTFEVLNLLRPQLNQIAKKYDIEINENEFAKVSLTDLQWMAVREGVPYKEVVPKLPVITNDERVDYFAQKK